MAKNCTYCKESKESAKFSPDKRARDGLQSRCKACNLKTTSEAYYKNHDLSKAKGRSRYKNNPDRCVSNQLKINYGITLDDKKRMYEKQEGRCAVCEDVMPILKKACVDHNHGTGKVRELLCGNCNAAEGMLKGNCDRAYKLAFYMRKHQEI